MISSIDNLGDAGLPASTPASGQCALVPAASSQLLVPHGTAALITSQPIQDVRAYLLTRTPVPDYEQERHLFDRLPTFLRDEVRLLQAAVFYVRRLTTGEPAIKVQPACRRALAIYPQFEPLKTFRPKYDAWQKSQDWFLLVNRARAGALWQAESRGLPEKFLDYVAARMGDFKRGDAGEQAILSIKRHWQTGLNHRNEPAVIPGYETNWEVRQRALLPAGWSSTNIRKQLKARAKFTKAVKALRHEGCAAARAYLPQTHSTRGGQGGTPLRFMELIQFDDVRCDFRVIDIATGQICDLWILIARDVATTMMLGFGMRPALARDDGTQEHLKLQDMKQLFGWLLETYGLPPWKMFSKIEHGTATLAEATRMALEEMLGDRIGISYSSMIGGKSSVGYAERAVGNSKGKAMLESLNRLQHMMTSHFPGQIGAHYGKRPAELIARENEAKEIWASHRPEDRAELVYPVLTISQAREKLFEVFRLQNQRTDHNCEDFAEVVEAFDGVKWQPATSAHVGCETRTRMESPVERAGRLLQGCEPFTRVSPEIITAFYEHSQRRRPVENNGQIEFMHEGKILRFAPPSAEFALPPETKCLCYFNPDDPRFLTLTDGRGGILGTWLRRGLARHADHDAVAAAIRHSTAALNVAKARATELASDEQASLTTMREHNAGFVTVVEPRTQAKTISSPVAGALRAVAGEKQQTKQQQQTRTDARKAAREALRNLAA